MSWTVRYHSSFPRNRAKIFHHFHFRMMYRSMLLVLVLIVELVFSLPNRPQFPTVKVFSLKILYLCISFRKKYANCIKFDARRNFSSRIASKEVRSAFCMQKMDSTLPGLSVRRMSFLVKYFNFQACMRMKITSMPVGRGFSSITKSSKMSFKRISSIMFLSKFWITYLFAMTYFVE